MTKHDIAMLIIGATFGCLLGSPLLALVATLWRNTPTSTNTGDGDGR